CSSAQWPRGSWCAWSWTASASWPNTPCSRTWDRAFATCAWGRMVIFTCSTRVAGASCVSNRASAEAGRSPDLRRAGDSISGCGDASPELACLLPQASFLGGGDMRLHLGFVQRREAFEQARQVAGLGQNRTEEQHGVAPLYQHRRKALDFQRVGPVGFVLDVGPVEDMVAVLSGDGIEGRAVLTADAAPFGA